MSKSMWMRSNWRSHLIALSIAIITIIALFFRDASAMAVIWWTSSTFNHCMAIIPIIGWLIWQRKDEVRALAPSAWPKGLWFVSAAALLWVLGEAAGLGLLRHAALVFMIQSATLTILGKQVARGIMFPLFYLVFVIPFGEELVPLLQTLTAKICVFLLAHSNIPAKIDGIFITVPNGFYQVAAACSGVKFLVAMLAYGSLAANVCFKSAKRRTVFMAAAIILPILANGVRAFGTIYIGYMTNTNIAKSFDHVVYGWFFFAFVMIVLMGASWHWFDRKLSDPWLGALPPATKSHFTAIQAALAIFMIALLPMVWNMAVTNSGHIPMENPIVLPEVAGWQRVYMNEGPAWNPRFDGADHRLIGRYRNANGETVDLSIALYGWQEEGRKIIGYAHGAVDPDGPWRWTSDEAAPAQGKAERILGPGKIVRFVESYYVVGGAVSANSASIKLSTMLAKLFGGDQSAVAILVSAPEGLNPTKAGDARAACDHFVAALGPLDKVAAGYVATARGR
jgi:exosortase A